MAACTYSITNHTLNCTPNAGGNALQLGPNGVFSGYLSGTNNPNYANDYLGPISPGRYNINKDYRPHHEHFWRLEPTPKVHWWQFYLGLARNGFELHPGSRSIGCITADKTDANTMKQYNDIDELLNRENGYNTLTVTR